MSSRWCSASSSKPATSHLPRNCKRKRTATCPCQCSRLTQTIGLHKKKLLKIIEKYVEEHPATLSKIGQEDEQEEDNGLVGKRKDSQTSLGQNPKKAKKTKQPVEEEEEQAIEENGDDIEEQPHISKAKAKTDPALKNKPQKPAPLINSNIRQQTNPDYSTLG